MGMLAWAMEARTPDEVARLVRALGKHRYVREADLRLHWTVDRVLSDLRDHPFSRHAQAFEALRARERIELASRDPRLWRPASADEVGAVLEAFWTPGPEAERRVHALERLVADLGLPAPSHDPFESPPDDPPHPELVLLDWELLAVDQLDTERHAGALAALEDSGDEIDPSEPIHQEGPVLSLVELTCGAHNGVLVADFLIWSDGPYAYSDYVLRGVAKAAKKDVDIKVYEPNGHAFMNPGNKDGFDDKAAQDAWGRIDAFFAKKLKG